jgi:hypothetical protein
MPGTPNKLLTTQTINNFATSFITGDGNVGTSMGSGIANTRLLYTAGPSGSIVKSLMACSDDGSLAHVVTLVYDNLTTKYPIGAVNVPINAGATGAIPNVDILGSTALLGFTIDAAGKSVLQLGANQKIWAGPQVSMTAGKTLTIFGIAEDF